MLEIKLFLMNKKMQMIVNVSQDIHGINQHNQIIQIMHPNISAKLIVMVCSIPEIKLKTKNNANVRLIVSSSVAKPDVWYDAPKIGYQTVITLVIDVYVRLMLNGT